MHQDTLFLKHKPIPGKRKDDNMSNTRSLAYGYVTQVFSENNVQYIFEDTPENIASFIVTNRNHQCTITDIGDNLIVTSLPGGFIDRCPNQTYLANELLPILIPMQLGEVEPLDIEFIDAGPLYDQEMI